LRSKDCELIQIGGIIDDKGYGIAAPSGSPWVNVISNAILQLKTYGELPELYQKWWGNEYNSKKCGVLTEKSAKANELGFSKLGGLFIIIAFTTCLSFIILLIEILWNTYKTSKNKVNYFKHRYIEKIIRKYLMINY
jgi:ionotropic glutamate receptor